MFKFLKLQLSFLYPNALLHVITNENIDMNGVVLHENKFGNNHLAKFQVFSLLKEPAMYLDCDILLNTEFSNDHLVGDIFKVYDVVEIYDMSQFSNVDETDVIHWNAGIIWIKNPSKEITDELNSIHCKYFNNIKYPRNSNNDEHALSYYINKHNIQQKEVDEVNKSRWKLKKEDIGKPQSVHYIGKDMKDLFLEECILPTLF